MLHQFEEHGIDLLGNHYAFQTAMCRTLGFENLSQCPADPWFIFAVNPGTVWIAGFLAGFLGGRRPIITATLIGVILVNGILHIGTAVRSWAYNPGLATSLGLFIPFSVWGLSFLRTRAKLSFRDLILAVGGGILLHLILVASLIARERGLISESALIWIQLLNALIPLLVLLVSRPSERLSA